MHLCDMDKYLIKASSSSVDDLNRRTLNFVIAKFLYYEMLKQNNFDSKTNKEELKKLSQWVKISCNSRSYLKQMKEEIKVDYHTPLSEYALYKSKSILR